MSNYAKLYASGLSVADSLGESYMDQFIADLDAAGIDYAICKLEDTESVDGRKVSPDFVGEFTRRYPKFIGFMGINPLKGMTAVREMERSVRECNITLYWCPLSST